MVVRNSRNKSMDLRRRILDYIDSYAKECGCSPAEENIQDDFQFRSRSNVKYHIDWMETEGWITSFKTDNETGIQKRLPRTLRLTEKGQRLLAEYQNERSPGGPGRPDPVEQPGKDENPERRCEQKVLDVHYVILSARLSNHSVADTINIRVDNLIAASFGEDWYSSDPSVSGLGTESYLSIRRGILPAGLALKDLFALEVRGNSMIGAGIRNGDYVIVKQTMVAENGDMCVVLIDGEQATLKYFHREGKRIRLEAANSRIDPQTFGPDRTVTIQGKVVLVVRV